MILIATPTRDSITAGTTGDLIKLCRRHPDAKWVSPTGIYIGNLRQIAVRIAQQVRASHILFIDSDMRFPEDTLDRLLQRSYDIAEDITRDVFAANYVQRTAPQWWTARKNGQWLSSVGRTGCEQVDAIGFGCALIRMNVFDRIQRPWFDTPYDGENHIGEDLSFCSKALSDWEIWIDHDLSQQVRHQGTIELGVGTST